MGDSSSFRSFGAARYRVRLLGGARLTGDGVAHGDASLLLPWDRVKRALSAEVGEPEGVRTVVFDLVVELDESGCEVCRLDADPHDDAKAVARAIEAAIGAERVAPSIKSVAAAGVPNRWYPDLEAFAEAALEELLGRPR